MIMCNKNAKKHQQISNLEIYSDQHYTNSLQQQSIVITTMQIITAECIMTACCMQCFFILSFIQCSREKNNMNVISEVTLYCIPVYCVQHIELDNLSKLMLKKKGQNTQLFSFYLV